MKKLLRMTPILVFAIDLNLLAQPFSFRICLRQLLFHVFGSVRAFLRHSNRIGQLSALRFECLPSELNLLLQFPFLLLQLLNDRIRRIWQLKVVLMAKNSAFLPVIFEMIATEVPIVCIFPPRFAIAAQF